MISEELLHFIWQFRFFDQFELYTQTGEKVSILEVGMPNSDAGPDFLHARLRIAEQEWHGHVEIHVNAKDWVRHSHDEDPAYNNVILHVVWEGVGLFLREDGTAISTLQIGDRVGVGLLDKYRTLRESKLWIPCEKQLKDVDALVKTQLLQRQLVERLGYKYSLVYELLNETANDWERVLFVLVCRSFGMKVNAQPFMMLGKVLDLGFFRKYQDDWLKLEAMIFGQAGLLDIADHDSYVEELLKEYTYLKEIHILRELNPAIWRFMRMRPYNFPTFRIAQLVSLYKAKPALFADVLFADHIKTVYSFFEDVRVSAYWSEHFLFGHKTSAHSRRISPSFVNHLLINAFIPVMFAYGKAIDDLKLQYKAVEWLEAIAAEKNNITFKFAELGMPIRSSADSQAVLHLKEHACDKKKCLQCAVGLSLLRH